MAATITDQLKKDILENLYSQYLNDTATVGDSDRFYVGIGRAEAWADDTLPPIPNPSSNEVLKFQETLQSIKLVSDVSYVVPRYNWTAGNQYEQWQDEFSSNTTVSASGDIQNPYYVITDDNNVFVCVQQGKTANGVVRNSTFKPTDVTGNNFAAGDDGYIWRHLFNIGAAEARKYLTSAYMPVEKLLADSVNDPRYAAFTTSRQAHWAIQEAAVPGEVIGIVVDSGGTGFTSAPTLTITGVGRDKNGIVTEAEATARIDTNGNIYEVIMRAHDSASAPFRMGEGYKQAFVTVTGGGGSGAVLRPVVSGDSGMGGNVITSLNSSALMFHSELSGSENNDFQVTNDFRQIGIIKNPMKDSAVFGSFTGDSAVSSQTAQAYRQLRLDSSSVSFANDISSDQTITQATSGASAILDYYDATTSIAYVHQSRETGFLPFDSTNSVSFLEGGSSIGTANIIVNATGPNLRPAETDNFSGEVIYIDNRTPITRDDEQTEDIKIVIDL